MKRHNSPFSPNLGLTSIKQATLALFQHPKQLFYICGFWWTLSIICDVIPGPVLSLAFGGDGHMSVKGSQTSFVDVMATIVQTMALVSVAIAWHRVLIMDDKRSGILYWPKTFRRLEYFIIGLTIAVLTLFFVLAPFLIIYVGSGNSTVGLRSLLGLFNHPFLNLGIELAGQTLVLFLLTGFGLALPANAVSHYFGVFKSARFLFARPISLLVVALFLALMTTLLEDIEMIVSQVWNVDTLTRATQTESSMIWSSIGLVLVYQLSYFLCTFIGIGILSFLYKGMLAETQA